MRLVFSFLLLLVFVGLQAQTGSGDAATAQPVCGNSYTQDSSVVGLGNMDELDGGVCSICLENGENNSSWYIFTVQTAGDLTFDITPLGIADYDFTLYNITGVSYNDSIFCNGSAIEVRCNYAFGNGITGIRPTYPNITSNASGDQFLAPLPVSVGETYLLLIDNFQSTGTGYQIDFTGTADIADVTGPQLSGVSGEVNQPFSCTPQSYIILQFDEPVVCSSINTTGAGISITGPSAVQIVSVEGVDCSAGSSNSQFIRINFNAQIAVGGAYTLNVPAGTFEDICTNVNPLINTIFDIPYYVDADFTYTIQANCISDVYLFDNTSTGIGFSQVVWDFGDFTTSNNVDTVSHPFLPGSYNVELAVIGIGPDFCSDTLIQAIQVGSSFGANFSFSPQNPCPGDVVTFTKTSNATGAYYWDFGDGGATSNLENPTKAYTSPGNYTVLFEISDPLDPTCSDTISAIVTVRPVLDATPQVDVNPFCEGQPATFTAQTIGSPQSWLWAFSNGDSIVSDVAVITFDSGGFYDVNLYVVDSFCGTVTAPLTFEVIDRPNFTLGNDTLLCLGDSVGLDLPTADSYAWSTGQSSQSISYDQIPGQVSGTIETLGCFFSDTLYINERTEGCFVVLIPTAFSPNGDGINDYVRIFTEKIATGTIKIYNRWGQMVYEGNIMAENTWNGTVNDVPQEVGTYSYIIEAKPLSDKPIFYQSGIVTLVK